MFPICGYWKAKESQWQENLKFQAFKKLVLKLKIREQKVIDLENYKIMGNLKNKQGIQTLGVGETRSGGKKACNSVLSWHQKI